MTFLLFWTTPTRAQGPYAAEDKMTREDTGRKPYPVDFSLIQVKMLGSLGRRKGILRVRRGKTRSRIPLAGAPPEQARQNLENGHRRALTAGKSIKEKYFLLLP